MSELMVALARCYLQRDCCIVQHNLSQSSPRRWLSISTVPAAHRRCVRGGVACCRRDWRRKRARVPPLRRTELAGAIAVPAGKASIPAAKDEVHLCLWSALAQQEPSPPLRASRDGTP